MEYILPIWPLIVFISVVLMLLWIYEFIKFWILYIIYYFFFTLIAKVIHSLVIIKLINWQLKILNLKFLDWNFLIFLYLFFALLLMFKSLIISWKYTYYNEKNQVSKTPIDEEDLWIQFSKHWEYDFKDILNFDKGNLSKFWLDAPQGVGKTTFIDNLKFKIRENDELDSIQIEIYTSEFDQENKPLLLIVKKILEANAVNRWDYIKLEYLSSKLMFKIYDNSWRNEPNENIIKILKVFDKKKFKWRIGKKLFVLIDELERSNEQYIKDFIDFSNQVFQPSKNAINVVKVIYLIDNEKNFQKLINYNYVKDSKNYNIRFNDYKSYFAKYWEKDIDINFYFFDLFKRLNTKKLRNIILDDTKPIKPNINERGRILSSFIVNKHQGIQYQEFSKINTREVIKFLDHFLSKNYKKVNFDSFVNQYWYHLQNSIKTFPKKKSVLDFFFLSLIVFMHDLQNNKLWKKGNLINNEFSSNFFTKYNMDLVIGGPIVEGGLKKDKDLVVKSGFLNEVINYSHLLKDNHFIQWNVLTLMIYLNWADIDSPNNILVTKDDNQLKLLLTFFRICDFRIKISEHLEIEKLFDVKNNNIELWFKNFMIKLNNKWRNYLKKEHKEFFNEFIVSSDISGFNLGFIRIVLFYKLSSSDEDLWIKEFLSPLLGYSLHAKKTKVEKEIIFPEFNSFTNALAKKNKKLYKEILSKKKFSKFRSFKEVIEQYWKNQETTPGMNFYQYTFLFNKKLEIAKWIKSDFEKYQKQFQELNYPVKQKPILFNIIINFILQQYPTKKDKKFLQKEWDNLDKKPRLKFDFPRLHSKVLETWNPKYFKQEFLQSLNNFVLGFQNKLNRDESKKKTNGKLWKFKLIENLLKFDHIFIKFKNTHNSEKDIAYVDNLLFFLREVDLIKNLKNEYNKSLGLQNDYKRFTSSDEITLKNLYDFVKNYILFLKVPKEVAKYTSLKLQALYDAETKQNQESFFEFPKNLKDFDMELYESKALKKINEIIEKFEQGFISTYIDWYFENNKT